MSAANPAPDRASPWPLHGALIAAQAGFALFPIFGKLALKTIPPLDLAALRVVAAALFLEVIRRMGPRETVRRGDGKAILFYALLGISFNQVLFLLGLSLTTAIDTTILTATIPIFTLGAAVLLRREPMTARAGIGIALALSGSALLLHAGDFDWHSRAFLGNVLLLGNSLSYSLYLVLSRPILARYGTLTFVSRVFVFGAGPVVLVALPALFRFESAHVTALSWASLAAIVVFCTVLPYLANAWALARASASRVAIYTFLQPVIAAALAIAVLHEALSLRRAAAAGLILAGLAVSLARGRARPPDRVFVSAESSRERRGESELSS